MRWLSFLILGLASCAGNRANWMAEYNATVKAHQEALQKETEYMKEFRAIESAYLRLEKGFYNRKLVKRRLAFFYIDWATAIIRLEYDAVDGMQPELAEQVYALYERARPYVRYAARKYNNDFDVLWSLALIYYYDGDLKAYDEVMERREALLQSKETTRLQTIH